MNFDKYTVLTEEEQKLLCFYGYMGRELEKTDLEIYAKGFSLKNADCRECCQQLVHKGFLMLSGYTWNFNAYLYMIHPDHFLAVLYLLAEKYPGWKILFNKLHLPGADFADVIYDMIDDIRKGKPLSVSTIGCSEKLVPVFLPVAFLPEFYPLLIRLNNVCFQQFFSSICVRSLETDVVDSEDALPRMLKENPNLSLPERKELTEMLALYRYFSHGEYKETKSIPKTLYALILRGIHDVNRGKYREALAFLTQAMKIRNKMGEPKNVLLGALNCFYLIMAYVHEGSEESRVKLQQFLRKKISDFDTLLPACILAECFTDKDREINRWKTEQLFTARAYSDRKLYAYIGFLFVKHFNLEVTKEPDFSDFMPNQLILKHELSSFLPLSDEERNSLKAIYGDLPALTSIHIKKKWEMVIDDLLTEAEKETSGDKKKLLPEKPVRLMYLVRGVTIELREQALLNSGQWGSGKAISWSRYTSGALDFMDEVDLNILDKLKIRGDYMLLAKDVLGDLVGSDRIYAGYHAPFEPVTVEEEKPYLIVEKKADGFQLISNIPVKELSDSSPIIIERSKTHYVVINLTTKQRKYYERLLTLQQFPLEAENALKEFLPKISHTVEVHSSLVDGGTTLDTLAGEAALCLQINPFMNCFNLSLFAKPMPEGKVTLSPGKGQAMVVDEKAGTRYRVKRQLSKEKENLEALSGYVEDAFGKSFANDSVSLYPEELLSLMDYVRQSPTEYFVEWPEGEKVKLIDQSPAGNWNIKLKAANQWFEVEGDVRIDEHTVLTMAQFLELLSQSKGQYIRLNETDYIRLGESIRKQLKKLESLTFKERGKSYISRFNAGLLDEVMDGEIEIGSDETLDKLRNCLKQSRKKQAEVPVNLQATLRDYQMEGFQWMTRLNAWGAGACLADDMGLGKTVQTIAYLLHKAGEGASLVVAPASVVPNWAKELQRFAPTLNVSILNRAEDRNALILQSGASDVVLTTYGLLVTEAASLCNKEWNIVCLDEAHTIKNRETKMSASAMQLRAANKLVLTGTPIQNYLGELWNLFQFINPGLLGGYEQFQRKYILPIEQEKDKERQQQLKRIVHPFMLRRTKAEVVEELPDKMEIILPVELSEEEMGVYEVMRRRAEVMLESEDKVNVTTLAEITRLRQAACCVSLVEKKWKGECAKISMLLSLLDEIKGSGNRVLVFSQFTSFFSLVRQALDQAGEAYLYLDGSTPMKQREQLVEDFQRGTCPVFLISLKAGGLGLNLTGANYVIHLDPWWNPAVEQQATDRAYRIGQQQKVTVYHLIAQHTIEEKILRMHRTKRDLADSLLEGTDMSHKLTNKDLLEMLSKEQF